MGRLRRALPRVRGHLMQAPRGFAPSRVRRHLNTWCAHGHRLQLLSEVRLPQACWSVESRKKNLFDITEFLGKCQLSHPIVSGAGTHLLTSERRDRLPWPYFGERAVCGGPIVPRQLSVQVWACRGEATAAHPAAPSSCSGGSCREPTTPARSRRPEGGPASCSETWGRGTGEELRRDELPLGWQGAACAPSRGRWPCGGEGA